MGGGGSYIDIQIYTDVYKIKANPCSLCCLKGVSFPRASPLFLLAAPPPPRVGSAIPRDRGDGGTGGRGSRDNLSRGRQPPIGAIHFPNQQRYLRGVPRWDIKSRGGFAPSSAHAVSL